MSWECFCHFCCLFQPNLYYLILPSRKWSWGGWVVWVMVLNSTFNNISVISWQSLLLVEETRVPRENHLPVCIKINKVGKQEVGIWWIQKCFPRYGVPIWSLWPNIRSLPSIVAEKNVTKNVHICYAHFSSHFSQQLLMAEIWYLVTSFI
jgi:hypothetical protein